ncbi:stage II sporulation protein M [Allonocardiopsis opalescens]|uniref:Putative membrane protein SpoIIM required for sporulation n=1 Tax=Allonocardiopsis opalescens TaxID=1144618 RepID=A0A2T0QCB0_9ACTN|nr:stage II sporulation protein M [Allonocardiopsis opalescens]PRY01510.1 putative membrane protein SpoIIM required for sporulation [Allonocardiopsis opalescens]
MNLDAFVAAHHEEWRRLEQLVARRRRLTGTEVDELVDLYQRSATHLSLVRSAQPDPALVNWLSALVARARSAVTGSHAPLWREFTHFFTRGFPAAVYRVRWWWLATSIAFVLVSTAIGWWVAATPQVQASLVPAAEVQQLVEQDFANYYTESPSAAFTARVWTNNVQVAAVALILGVLLGIPTLWILWGNAASLGTVGGFMFAHDRGDIFFGLILPHGLLELTAVFLAGGVGLRLGWTVVDPGRRTRGRALAEEGRAAVGIALGLIVVLGVSGLIEGFVTGYVHVTWIRVGIGAVALALFLAYILVLGRRAVREGETGDTADRPDVLPTAG